jgi:hypothetical protein
VIEIEIEIEMVLVAMMTMVMMMMVWVTEMVARGGTAWKEAIETGEWRTHRGKNVEIRRVGGAGFRWEGSAVKPGDSGREGDGRGGTRGRALSSISVRDFKGITIMLYSIQISRFPLPISNYPRRSSAYFPTLKGVEVIARAEIDENLGHTILPIRGLSPEDCCECDTGWECGTSTKGRGRQCA